MQLQQKQEEAWKFCIEVTRGNEESVSASKAILEGLASDGGLFVPQALPSFDKTLDEFAQMDYRRPHMK